MSNSPELTKYVKRVGKMDQEGFLEKKWSGTKTSKPSKGASTP